MDISNQNLPTSLILALVTQIVAATAILLDIPLVRQVTVFLLLTFIPGLILMRVIKYNRSSLVETLLFSVGLSLAFLMLVGFLINEFGLMILIAQPLATGPLFIILNIIISLLCIISFYTGERGSSNFLNNLKLHSLIFLILPLLAALGVLLALALNSNLLLIMVYVVIAAIFVLSLFTSRSSPHYTVIIFSIGLALLLCTVLSTKYVYGADIALEYGVFKETQSISSLAWEPYSFEQIAAKSMLSVTILPTIYSNLMNISGTLVFKIIFTFIFSLVPIGLYQLYQVRWGNKIAFTSVIFFMATYGFYASMIAQGKQMVAELFYVLLFLVIFKEKLSYNRNDWIIIMFLVFGLVVSHYSISYIFIFIILSTVLGLKLLFKNKSIRIKPTIVAFSLCLAFLWYTYLVYGPFEKFVSMISYTVNNFFSEFFYLGSRGESVQRVLGTIEAPTLLHNIGTYVYVASTLLILVGFVSLLWIWRRDKLHSELFMVTSLNMGLLFSAVIIPRFAGFLEMWRLYHIALLFVAPLFVLGLKSVVAGILKLKKGKKLLNSNYENHLLFAILTSIILVPHFLFQTGWVYEIAGDPTPSSIALSKDKMDNIIELIEEGDVFSASWLSKYGKIANMCTYSDTVALLYVLQSYSDIDRRNMLLLSNTTQKINYYDTWRSDFSDFSNNSYIYLRQYNVINEMTFWDIRNNIQYNFTELPILDETTALVNKIYTNSGSEVYYHFPLP